MSNNVKRRDDCKDCNTSGVEFTAGVGGELWGQCPNCERGQTRYDKDYEVVDSDDTSQEAVEARGRNIMRGFWS